MPKNQIESEIEYVLSTAMAKCGDLHNAQDLAQETLLCALLYLEKGGIIDIQEPFLQPYSTANTTICFGKNTVFPP